MNYAVIMAGGTGKRLWPLSRKARPKQVLKLLDNEQTLLGDCFDRLRPVFEPDNILVQTNVKYRDIVRDALEELPADNIIGEPVVRDTAGAIALAATVLSVRDPDATMVVVTADQVIRPAEKLQQAIADAVTFVNNNPQSLVTFGIRPDFASTQLGYIKCVEPKDVQGCENKIYTVDSFREKPDKETAQQYLSTGQYFWNSGMFVWKAKTILDNLQKFLPESTEPLKHIRSAWGTPDGLKVLDEQFARLPKISIDFAVMEKAENVFAIRLDCKWLDMGSFAALADIVEPDENGNIVRAKMSELLDCSDNIIVTQEQGHLIAAIGLKGMIVAHTKDATLVCPAGQDQRLKEMLELIEKKKETEKFL